MHHDSELAVSLNFFFRNILTLYFNLLFDIYLNKNFLAETTEKRTLELICREKVKQDSRVLCIVFRTLQLSLAALTIYEYDNPSDIHT